MLPNSNPPRIHTLRSGDNVPATSDCFTPRTMIGNDAAFKGAEYGAWVEGPFSRPTAWIGRTMWIGVGALALGAALLFALR